MNGLSLSKQASKQARVDYIDLFRAFGIILMIMGHITFGGVFNKFIHAFHMPMFFFISGWFYKRKEDILIGEIILRKAKTLLLPYLCFGAIVWLLCLMIIPEYRQLSTLYYFLFENTYAIPVAILNNLVSPIPGALWFLTAIFLTEVIYVMLDRWLGCNWKLHISVVLLVIVGMLIAKILPFRLPWAMDAAFVGVGFFHIARVSRGTKAEKLLNLKLWQALVLGAVISASIMALPRINMRTGLYGWYISFWVNALGAIVAGWNLTRYTEKLLNHGIVLERICEWLKGIGKNSIVYLCLNQITILAVMIVIEKNGFHGFVSKILNLILTMAILFGFEKLICNTKLKILIGK
ncbi:Fucose 4-O-acetylase [Lachnospiraceae bacterium NE2001]|nr:Fucose 4-O-acetylase [Lachnospiraceae bacterium NE2001]